MTDSTPTTTAVSTYTPAQVAEHRRAWVTALRSGEYQQGFEVLRTPEDGYCCLGVAEAVRGATFRRHPVGFHGFKWVIDDELLGERGVKTTLTIVGRLWLGLRAVDPLVPYQLPGFAHWSIEALSALNDSTSWTLERIADVVEALPLEWDGTVSWARTYVD